MAKIIFPILFAGFALVIINPHDPPPCVGRILSYTQHGHVTVPDVDCSQPPDSSVPEAGVDVPLFWGGR